jgi:ribosomal protein S1
MDKINNLYKVLDKSIAKIKFSLYQKGDIAEGVVDKISPSLMVVKIDSVFDAIVPASEIDKEVASKLKKGDKVKIFIVKPEDEYGVMIASQKRTTSSQRWDLLEQAQKNDEAVTVDVIEANNGGVIVRIDGVIGFIPTSQLDPNRVYKLDLAIEEGQLESNKDISRKLADLVGNKLKVKIMEVDKDKNKVIFSEKLLLTDQPSELRQQTIKNIKVGDILDSVVTAVTPYGIFVNAQGLDGLIHVSEISWDKVENPGDYAKVGDSLKVKLINLGDDGRKVAYSLKQLSDDPWSEISEELKVGSVVEGTVTDVEEYGLIVKVGEGVTGLIHKTEFEDSNASKNPIDVYKVGDKIKAVIMTISPSDRKMGLSIKKLTSRKSKSSSSKSKRKKKTPGSLDVAGALAAAGIEVK